MFFYKMSLNDVFISAHTVMSALSAVSSAPTFDTHQKQDELITSLRPRGRGVIIANNLLLENIYLLFICKYFGLS